MQVQRPLVAKKLFHEELKLNSEQLLPSPSASGNQLLGRTFPINGANRQIKIVDVEWIPRPAQVESNLRHLDLGYEFFNHRT